MVLSTVVTAIWLMLPAYLPNSAAVLTGGGPPIDGGRTWRGNRILGDGKTVRGTLGGISAGILLALILNRIHPSVQTLTGVDLWTFPVTAILTLPVGALLGDMVASFIKRRVGRERGAPFPGLDQLDFVIGALTLTLVAAPAWLLTVLSPAVLLAILILTPLFHLTVNVIGFKAGLKDEPW